MKEIEQLNGLTLAFMGDAIMSLKARKYYIEQGFTKPNDLQKLCVGKVSAVAQAKAVKQLMDNDFFTQEEILIIKRGRNCKSKSSAKNADIITYRMSTGFEALWGYLYLCEDNKRIEEIWNAILELED